MVETPSGLSEGFEGSFPPYGWTMVSMNDNNSISQSASSAYEGVYSARFSSYNSASSSTGDYTQYMVSPKLVVGSGESFSFWHDQSSFSGESFMVGVSTTDDLTSFVFGDEVVRASGSSGTWEQHVEDLSAYDGQEIYVAIKYTSNYLYYLYIDHVEGPAVYVNTEPVASVSPEQLDFAQ